MVVKLLDMTLEGRQPSGGTGPNDETNELHEGVNVGIDLHLNELADEIQIDSFEGILGVYGTIERHYARRCHVLTVIYVEIQVHLDRLSGINRGYVIVNVNVRKLNFLAEFEDWIPPGSHDVWDDGSSVVRDLFVVVHVVDVTGSVPPQ